RRPPSEGTALRIAGCPDLACLTRSVRAGIDPGHLSQLRPGKGRPKTLHSTNLKLRGVHSSARKDNPTPPAHAQPRPNPELCQVVLYRGSTRVPLGFRLQGLTARLFPSHLRPDEARSPSLKGKRPATGKHC